MMLRIARNCITYLTCPEYITIEQHQRAHTGDWILKVTSLKNSLGFMFKDLFMASFKGKMRATLVCLLKWSVRLGSCHKESLLFIARQNMDYNTYENVLGKSKIRAALWGYSSQTLVDSCTLHYEIFSFTPPPLFICWPLLILDWVPNKSKDVFLLLSNLEGKKKQKQNYENNSFTGD